MLVIERIWCGVVQRPVPAEVGRERVGQTPRQHPATGPVQDREQVHKAALHRNVRLSISLPDMV